MKIIKNYLTAEECQLIIDSCNDERGVGQGRTKFKLPKSVLRKLSITHRATLEVAIQYYEVGDSFMPHRDLQGNLRRVSSMSILLNDEFKGGDLMVEHQKATMNKGDATLFTPQDLHWVTGILEGHRYVLAVWGVK
tara:strand:- start:4705 stop:5112 length:408 start_codon:yes stop_codon:yes gene_type:complete